MNAANIESAWNYALSKGVLTNFVTSAGNEKLREICDDLVAKYDNPSYKTG